MQRDRKTIHPTRARILYAMSDGQAWSPHRLQEELGETLGAIAYHVRLLAADERIKLARETRVRGAVEHHYKLVGRNVTGPERLAVLALRAADTLEVLKDAHPDGPRVVMRLVGELRKANPIEPSR